MNANRIVIEHVLKLARAAPVEVLDKSLRDCHSKGLDSIVIYDDGGKLTRVFIAHEPVIDVGIHNHRYPLRLSYLTGMVTHMEFAYSCIGQNFECWRFGPRGSAMRKDGARLVAHFASFSLAGPGEITLSSDVLHTVHAHAGSAWLVEELAVGHGGETTLLTHGEPSVEGLYNPHPDPLGALEAALA